MTGTNAFYLLFAFEQNSLNSQFYSKTAPAGTVDVKPLLNQLTEIKEFFDYEVYSLYYDKINLDSFLISLKDDVSRGALRIKLLNSNASNWNQKPPYPGVTKLGGRFVKGDTFSYVSLIHTNGSLDVNAILDMDAMTGTYPGFCAEVLKPEITAIHNWFTNNRMPKRLYHLSLKHGENGKGNISGASVLLGSKVEAEQLLHKAIGTKGKKDLYIFDNKYGKYMRFLPENANNTYHSFHIDEDEIDPPIKSVICKKLGKI